MYILLRSHLSVLPVEHWHFSLKFQRFHFSTFRQKIQNFGFGFVFSPLLVFFSLKYTPPTTTYSGVTSKIRVFSRVFSIPYHYILWCACFLEYSESSDNLEILLFFGKGIFWNFREREPLIAKKFGICAFSAVGESAVIVTVVVTNGWNR